MKTSTTILTLLVSIFVISCKEKLPDNIAKQVDKVNSMIEIVNKYDSVIMVLDESSIDKLSIDSLEVLSTSYYYAFTTYYIPAKKELDELLKYNAKFSDYPEVKNLKKLIQDTDIDKYFKNKEYIVNRYNYLKFNIKL